MSTIKKYSKKDIYLQKKDMELLMNSDWNSIIMEYQKTIKVWKTSRQNNSETVTNENDEEIPKEIYIATEERQKVIDNLRLIIII